MPLKAFSLEGRYASALFNAGIKAGKLEVIESEIAKVQKVISKSEMLQKLLENPIVGRDLKRQYVESLLTKEQYSEHMVNFFKILAENGRLVLTGKIIACFEEILKAHRDQYEANIISAKELPTEMMEQVKDMIAQKFGKSGANLQISTRVDPSLLGGMIVQIGDQTIDMSVASRLNKIKAAME